MFAGRHINGIHQVQLGNRNKLNNIVLLIKLNDNNNNKDNDNQTHLTKSQR